MAQTTQIDQDALAAEWGVALESETGTPAPNAEALASAVTDDAAAQWAAMADDGSGFQSAKGGAERILNQEEIDSLLGFSLSEVTLTDNSGIRAIIDSAMVSYERLPMLEIVFDRLVRLMTTSLRNFTSDNVEVSLDRITSVRFGDYLNSIPLPAILAVFKAEEWENFGLATVNSSLIYSIIDVLLGGRRGASTVRVEGRPYTTIETNLVKRMIEVVLADAELAFKPLSPVKFNIDRLETNPRFAAISRPANAAILVRLRIDMEDRGGNIELLLPYATIEPIRATLLQMFMGEKFGRDPIWEGHLATEIGQAQIDVDAVLYEQKLPLRKMMALNVGDTLMLELKPEALVSVRCGDITLTEGRMGKVGDRVAVRVAKPLRRPRTTFAMFEKADGGPVSYHYGFLVETMVSVLLLLTILYCVRLNKQLRLLKADEQSLRATISELITATEIAERAIGGLKATMRDGEQTLNERLSRSEQMSSDIERQLKAGEELLAKITRIAGAGRAEEPPVAAVVPDAKSVAAAAQAFAERTRARLSGQSSGHSNGHSNGLAA